MINIVKNTNSVVIESTIKIFPFEDGKIILPLNSVTYQLGDSNYISFKNVNDNKTIFAANINDIQVNGQAITPDDAITQLDSVLNGATGGGGGGGTSDYTQLSNKPQINGVELLGNKTLDSLGIQAKGEYVTKDVNNLDNYTNNTTLEAIYAKKTDLDNYTNNTTLEATYAKKTDLDNYTNTADLELNYAKKTDLDNYTNNTTLEATYAKKTDLNNYLTATQADEKFKTIDSEWFGTQQEYDAIDPKDPNVTYYIYEN